MPHRLQNLDWPIAIVGNAASWFFAAVSANDFAMWAAGFASISTGLYFLTKWLFGLFGKPFDKQK